MNLGVFYTVISALLYGCIGYFGVNLMQQGFSVCDLLLWRFLVSSLLLLPFLYNLEGNHLQHSKKNLLVLFLLGGVFYGGGTACYFEASKLVGTGLGMVIFFTYPLFVSILSVVINKAPLTSTTVASLGLIVVGLLLIAFGDSGSARMDWQGVLLGLASGLGYGLYVFGSKESGKSVPPQISAFFVCLGNTALFALYAFFYQASVVFPQNFDVWGNVFMFAFVGTVLPIFFLLQGMKTLSASKASIISVLEPVTILAVGFFVLEEQVSWLQLQGALVILFSAVLVQFDKEIVNVKSLG